MLLYVRQTCNKSEDGKGKNNVFILEYGIILHCTEKHLN